MTPEVRAKIEAAKAKVLAARNAQAGETSNVKSVVTAVHPGEAGRVSSTLVPDNGPGIVGVSVVTEVQPPDVVVVERPEPEGDKPAELVTKLDLSNPIHASFLQRISDLEAALLTRDPLMATHLKEIHKTMIEYEEISPLLSVEEISKIMAAQQTHVAVFLRQEVVKSSKAAASKKAAKVTLEDI